MTTKALIDPSSAAQSILDYPLALSRVGGDKELLKELGDLFLEEYPQLLAEIHDAHKQGAAAQLGRVAHSLKGSVANFGAKDAVELAAQLEQCGAKGNLAAVDEMLHALDLVLLSLQAELARL